MITRLGKYKNLIEIGKSAHGIVYKGYDASIDRIIAAKPINNINEAKHLGELNHPNITMIYDIEKEQDSNFIVMEYVEGKTIKELIKENANISIKDKIKIIILAARALHYAHQRGFIHKNVKPANIMLLDDLQVKIMDFGITETSDSQTQKTPFYLSPEQALGEEADRQSDIYSLSIAAYEFFTGKKPFIADSVKGLIDRIVKELPPSPTELNKTIPLTVSNIILKGIEKNKQHRYKTASDLADDLEIFLHKSEKRTSPAIESYENLNIDEIVKSLSENYDFFSNLTEDELKQIINLSSFVSYPKGRVIFKQGAIGDKMYIIIEGEIRITKSRRSEEEVATLGILKAGACFGEMAIIDQTFRSASAIAETYCVLLAINEVVLRRSSESLCFKLYKSLSSVLSERLRLANEKNDELTEQITQIAQKKLICACCDSIVNSGVFNYLLPYFEEETGIKAQILSVNSQLAIELGKRGKVDTLFVDIEDATLDMIVEDGFVKNYEVMFSDLLLVGPFSNPANINSINETVKALKMIAEKGDALFVTNGDNSGNYSIEKELWNIAGINPKAHNWYIEVNQSQRDTLAVANNLNAYTLTDRATFYSFAKTDTLKLEIMCEGEPYLVKQYSVMAVSPLKHHHVNYNASFDFINWLISDRGQELIENFYVFENTPIFISKDTFYNDKLEEATKEDQSNSKKDGKPTDADKTVNDANASDTADAASDTADAADADAAAVPVSDINADEPL
ncbi:serine/threonine protein kinase [Candidatus Magnetoovum chiemensis]|nr:serine/threonine protein kinase [Candidatus Magnetoovum chiemensis]